MVKEYWEGVEDRGQDIKGPSAESMVALPALESMLPKDMRGMRVLDTWCGDGSRAIAIARRGAQVSVMNESELLLNRTFQRLAMEGLHAELMVGGPEAFAHVPDGAFDLVTGDDGLLSASAPVKALRQLARVVRPGGAVILTLPHPVLSGGSVLTDGRGSRQWMLRDYFEAGRTEGVSPRTLADYINPIVAAGLLIESVHEPRPPVELRKLGKDNWTFFDRVPQYLIVVARKPGRGAVLAKREHAPLQRK